MSELYDETLAKDAELAAKVESLCRDADNNPKSREAYDVALLALREAMSAWHVCELKLGSEGKKTGDESIIREANEAHKNYVRYDTMRAEYTERRDMNTNGLYRFGRTMQATGKSMQDAGNAMSSVGDRMTVGCTIPALVVLLLLILIMMFL